MGPVAATTKVEEDVDGCPLGGAADRTGSGHHRSWRSCQWWARWGCCRRVQQWPRSKLKMKSMVDPLGVLLVGPIVTITEAEEDVDGGPLGGCCRLVRQRPPPKLKKTTDVSYAAPHSPRIVNVALHREYSRGIVFIFSQGRKDLYHV
jgi:hypothetical protein